MEPITTSIAMSTTAAGTGVAAGTAGSAAASTSAVDVLRKTASIMMQRGKIQVVNESELVEEFAAPIYAGVAAATPNTTAGADTIQNKSHAVAEEKEKAFLGPESANPPNTKENTSVQAVQAEHSPEIQALLDNHYEAPTIEQQLNSGATQIVIERSIIDENVKVQGDKKTALCLIEERVIDRKYLEYGHLSDLMSEVRHGNIPSIRQIYLAIIDLTDLATFKVFRPVLMKYKLEDAQVQLRQISADLEKKSLKPELASKSSESYGLGRNVEKRSWYKTDLVTDKTGHKEVSVEKKIDLFAVNVRDVATKAMSREKMDQLLAKKNEVADLIDQDNPVVRIEKIFPSEEIATINKNAMAWTRERILTTTTQYTTESTFHHYGVDLDGFLGKKVTTSDRDVSISEKMLYSEYLSSSDNINLENVNTYKEAIKKFASLKLTTSMEADAATVAQYSNPGAQVQFDEGWVTYIPGGSIVNLGAKADLGAQITKMDYFWAGVDVATVAIACVTLGASSGATAAGKAALVAGAKTAVKGGVKVAAKQGAKAAIRTTVKQGTKSLAKAGSKSVVKQTGKVALRNTGKATAKQTGKMSIKNPHKAGVKSVQAQVTKKVTPRTVARARNSYLDDVVKRSEVKDTINVSKLKKRPWKRISPEKNRIMREQFANSEFKENLIKEWERVNNRKWPTYSQDVYLPGKKTPYRLAGQKYDAHHIQPLGMNGQNVASNLTPVHALDHADKMGIHSFGSPYDTLNKTLGAV